MSQGGLGSRAALAAPAIIPGIVRHPSCDPLVSHPRRAAPRRAAPQVKLVVGDSGVQLVERSGKVVRSFLYEQCNSWNEVTRQPDWRHESLLS